MLNWIGLRWSNVRSTIVRGDVRAFEHRYLPTAIVVGMVIGAGLSRISAFLAILLFLLGGFGVGYACRAYVSYRRRTDYMRRRGEIL